MRSIACRLAILLSLTVASLVPASGQDTSNTPDRLTRGIAPHVGQAVVVTTAPGVYLEGRLVAVGREGLTLDWAGTRSTLAWDDVQRVTRRGDSLVDGTLIGAAFGAGLLLLGSKGDVSADVLLRGTAAYAMTGLVLDLAHRGRSTIYVAPTRDAPGGPRCHPCRQARNSGAVVGATVSF